MVRFHDTPQSEIVDNQRNVGKTRVRVPYGPLIALNTWAILELIAYYYNGRRFLRCRKITGNENYAYAVAA